MGNCGGICTNNDPIIKAHISELKKTESLLAINFTNEEF